MNTPLNTLAFTLVCLSLACKTVTPAPEQTAAQPQPGSSRVSLSEPPTSLPFHVEVSKSSKSLPKGLHSFAFATSGGKWLFVGGRTNGFHRTSTSERTFPVQSANQQLVVFDLASGQSWSRDVPEAYRAQLSSTNAESFQDGDTLYVAGGYGSNCGKNEASCYGTYSNLTAIKVQDAIDGVVAGEDTKIAASIVSIEDAHFQVTGGILRKVGDYFYLVMGQNYSRIYKEGVTGEYSEQVRRLKLAFDGKNLTVSDYQEFGDPSGAQGTKSQFHRRDLNVTEAITPTGNMGLSVWGGVFTAENLGWPHPIYIEPQGTGAPAMTVDTTFEQKTNFYECANLLMYDSTTGAMYTTLLGGITDYYYDDTGNLVRGKDSNSLPWSRIITTLRRASDGTQEYVQPESQSLPGMIGANAAFVRASGVSVVPGTHEIVDYSKLTGNRVLVGYMVGGISSRALQASGTNSTQSINEIYEVYLVRP